jgi:hypothetical protein
VDTSTQHRFAPQATRPRRVRPLDLAWPLALLVTWAIALNPVPAGVGAQAATAAARLVVRLAMADHSASPSHGTTWLFDLPAQARGAVQIDVAGVRPATRPLLQRLAGMTSFDDHVDQCRPPATSCSTPGSGVDGRWGVHLDADTTRFTYPSNRFLVYHEIGHAEWGLLLGPNGQRAFADAVSRALRGRPCVNDQGGPCAVLQEMFADEFARYVGGFKASMSYYCTPPLLDAVAFAAVLDAADV